MSSQAMTSAVTVASETTIWLQDRVAEVRSLQLIERTLRRIEEAEFQRESPPYNTSAMTEIIAQLSEATGDEPAIEVAEAREELTTALQMWRLYISRRDARITAQTLRRFCQRGTSSLDTQALGALLRFYRNLAHLSQSQSKYDFIVTRLFTLGIEEHRRKLRFGRDQIAARLQQLTATWPELHETALPDTTEISHVVAQFTAFTQQANAPQQLEELVSSHLFTAIRAFKASLGESFYAPAVTAAAIACNVACADQFVTLLEQAGEQLNGAPENYGELAALFSDTSSLSADHNARLLREIQLATQQSAAPEREKLERLGRLLHLATTPPVEAPAAAVESSASPEAVPELQPILEVADDAALNETLEKITDKPENRVIVAMLSKSSPRVQKLDLRMFLSSLAQTGPQAPEPAEVTEARRQTLTLIISADHLQHLKAEAADEAVQSQEQKMTRLLAEMQAAGNRLQELIEQAAQPAQLATVRILGHVAGRLLDAQQTLQSAIFDQSAVRFARHQTAQNRADNKAGVSFTQSLKPSRGALSTSTALPQINKYKWLILATIVIAVASVVMQITSPDNGPAVTRDPEIRLLDLSQVPDGEALKGARTRRDLMICLVSEKWAQMSDDERREKLRHWLTFGKDKGVGIVTLLNEQGQTVGSASSEAITLEHP